MTHGQPGRLARLTEREREVLEAVVDLGSVEAAARALYVEPTTIRSRLSDGYKRLGVHNGIHAGYLLGLARASEDADDRG